MARSPRALFITRNDLPRRSRRFAALPGGHAHPDKRMARANVAITAVCTCLMLGGCSIGPSYFRPKAPVPAEYKEMAGWKTAEPRDHELRGNWWEVYNDPVINSLESQVSVSNQTLAQAEAQYRQARALVAQARAAYFPVVDLSASTNRSGASTSGSSSGASRGAVSVHSISLDATWEPDLWGRVRKTVEANVAIAQASAADVESSRLLLQAELAQNYFSLRALDAQQQILENTVGAYQKSLTLTQNRYDAGVVARLDVVQADAQLKSTQAQLLDVGVARAQFEHAIAVLIGKPPAEFSLPRTPLAGEPPLVPAGLPSELLERRPDIAAAERRVASANAQIGVAQAAYFPALSLSASGGFQSLAIGELLSAPARFWSLGATLAQTLFDAGARRARTAQAVAVYDATVAAYRQTVLTSFQEVEDNLAALRILEQEASVQAEALAGNRLTVELTLNQYKAGTVSYLNVIIAQAAALASERNAVDIRSRRLAANVALIRALGGGWTASMLPPAEQIHNAKRGVKP
jgi:NodT family efflux transporter outer membrane factor (OMF) lipoprotein